MKKFYAVLLCTVALMAVPAFNAWSQLSNYIFTVRNGSAFDMAGASMVFNGAGQAGSGQGGFTNRVSSGLPIGFTFTFNGVAYTTFSVSTNGVIGLGGTVTSSSGNSLTGAGTYPILAPFWDALRISGGRQGCGTPTLRYVTTGAAPQRVLVIEWRDVDLISFSPRWGTFQVHLYEGSNKIAFYYGRMSACDVCNVGYGCANTSATIGIAASAADYISVTPQGPGTASASRVSVFNSVNVNTPVIGNGDIYTFTPCVTTLTGRTGPGNGGSPGMNNGDFLFSGFQTQVGSSSVYRPFTGSLSDVTCNGTYTLTISGAAASEYYFGTPGTQTVTRTLTGGVIDTAAITFRPTTSGVRNATLTVTDTKGFSRSFSLVAQAPQVNYTGNVSQGGTTGMLHGDTLLADKSVPRFSSQSYQPFMLTNVSGATVPVTYQISGGNAQYSITGPASIPAGGSVTPTIGFNPTGFGRQPAQLTVNAGGEIRTFTLYAISAAPGGEFRLGTGSTSTLLNGTVQFVNRTSCLGDGPVSIPVTVTNTGFNDFNILDVKLYELDTNTGQGQGGVLTRDAQGAAIPVYDYILTDQPANGPINQANVLNFPISVPQGGTRTIYLTFSSRLPGKRYALAYVRTNGQNFSGRDTNGLAVEGLLNFGVYGRGLASYLSGSMNAMRPKAVVFPVTKVGDTSVMRVQLSNPGSCALRVSMNDLKIATGDVKEFIMINRPSANVDANGDLLIAPNSTDQQILIKFAPTQAGTRRATLVLRTNDSTIQIPGHTQRGVFYLDLVGSTPTMLAASNAEFGAALIGGGASEQQHQVVHLENTSGFPVEITSILIDGVDATEFVADGTNGLPTLPRTLMAGERLDLKLVFAPAAGGQSGPRSARVKLVLSSGDTTVAELSGFAGTRVLEVTPSTLTFGSITHGKSVRRIVRVTNNGTIAMRIDPPVIGGAGASDFSVSTLPRVELQPGQSEEIEVTYSPAVAGPTSATMTITSNAQLPGGLAVITLNGVAVKTHGADGGDPSQTTMGGVGRTGDEQRDQPALSLSGVDGEVIAGGVALRQSVPNPARDAVEISYRLAARGEVTLALYDANGRLVRVVEQGVREMGEQRVQVRVSDLASGVYHYRLVAGGHTLNQTMTVVK